MRNTISAAAASLSRSLAVENWHHVGGGDFVRDIGLVRCQVSERGGVYHARCYGLGRADPRVGSFDSADVAMSACVDAVVRAKA